MYRKFLAIILAFSMLVSLSGCTLTTANLTVINDDIEENTVEKGYYDWEIDRSVKKAKYYEYRKNYNIGSCKDLSGNVTVYCWFINDSVSSWNTLQLCTALDYTVKPAFDFIEQESKKYGIELSFDIKIGKSEKMSLTNDFDGIVNPDLHDGGSTKIIVNRIAEKLGYETDEELNRVLSRENEGEIIHLCLLNKSGITYTRHSLNVNTSFCEQVVFFSDGMVSDLSGVKASTVARQVLKLYGGVDTYGTYGPNKLGKEYFPTDIMVSEDMWLKNITIDELTAFMIGWVDEPHEIFTKPLWQQTEEDMEPIYLSLTDEEKKLLPITPTLDELRACYDEGTNGRLEGDITLVCIFADDTESSWKRADAVKYTNEYIIPAMEFVENEADAYGIDLNIEVEREYADIGYALADDADDMAFEIKPVSQYMGYSYEWEMYTAMKEEYGTEIAFMIVVNKDGRGHTFRSDMYYRTDTGIFLTEFAIVYGPDYTRNFARTVAHEFLHLFGADDYYEPEDRQRIASAAVPNDIMLCGYDRLEDNEISDITAFTLGWIDTPPEELYYDYWWTEEETERFIFTDRTHG